MTEMNNKERFKRAFSTIKTPDDFVLNLEEKPHKARGMRFRKFAAAACTVLAVLVGGTACYAADVGGIQRIVQIWIDGDRTDAVIITDSDRDYGIQTWIYQDKNGEIHSAGGVTINDDGTDSPLSEEDIKDFYESPHWAEIDGRIYITCRDQKIDITDKFDEDGICHVTVKDGKKTWYVITNKTGRLMSSPYRYEEEQWAENNSNEP